MSSGALHILQLRAILQRGGNERRPHRVRRIAMPEPQLLDICLHNRVDVHGTEVSAERLGDSGRGSWGARGGIPIIGMPGRPQIRPEALRRLGMNRHDRAGAA
jgi:hypothetical protein